MRNLIVFSLLTALLVGCGDSHESVSEDMVDKMEEMAEILEGVENEDDAKAAGDKLEDLAEDFKELAKRMKDLGDPSEEVDKQLEEKYGKEMKAIMERVGKSSMKLMKYPDLMKKWQDAMKDVDFGK